MKYKISRFNYYVTIDDDTEGGKYVFNTFTRNLVKLSQNLSDIDLLSLRSEDIHSLRKLGIIVDEGLDEIEMMHTYMDLIKYEQKKLNVTIIPTNNCNFRCIYCYQSAKAAIMSKLTMEKILKWFERNLHYYDELSLSWFGGEPLLCPDIMLDLLSKIQEMCKKYKVAMISSVTTNGYLLDLDTFKKFLSRGLLYYQITVDGDETTHNLQRPHKIHGDSYSRIMQNLSDIASLARHYRFEIGIRINISGKMKKENIISFIDKMAELFSDDKRFVIIWQWVRDWGGERIRQHDVANLVQTDSVCATYIDYAKSKGLFVSDLISSATGADSCEAYFKNGYVLNFDGRVFKCAMCMEDEKNNCIGYIDDNGIMQIEYLKELRWLAHDKVSEKCLTCVYLPICYTNRCHYSTKVKGKLSCMEYKDLILPQIDRMIEKHKYHTIGFGE